MSGYRRARRFVRLLRSFRLRDWTRHNVKAMWVQSEIGWRSKLPAIDDLTEEEWDRFWEATQ
jgi:hypothetical protein